MNINLVVVKLILRVAFPNQHIIDICYHFAGKYMPLFITGEKKEQLVLVLNFTSFYLRAHIL